MGGFFICKYLSTFAVLSCFIDMANYLIIGASSGIGAQIAQDLLASGHQVWGSYRNHPITDQRIQSFHFDSSDTLSKLPNELPETLDGFVYCVGSIQLTPISRVNTSTLSLDIQNQLIKLVELLQHIFPKLKKSNHASVVLFSSVAVQLGLAFHTQVGIVKGAIEGLSKSLAAEWAPSIRVNTIAPSLTDTPLAEPLLNTPEKKLANDQRHPLKRIGTVEDISNMACFLLSEKSSWITAQVLHVDGGMQAIK
jgi:NAD(P)-dependent dehydrogenase (short-subunit alcohol dehydrogenase family)